MMKDIAKVLGLITQLGVSMLVPILICLFAGVFLDRRLGTSPWIMTVGIILGVAAGFRSVYMMTAEFFKDKDDPLYYKKGKKG
ncbi:MAG: AtpZ/AtpI family protein [Firmicutes bacterium]|nr:AtpZ/AtpI family protein [Bacillota bacterium]